MREIKFRAKMVDFDGWVYGHYVNCRYKDKLETGHFIIKYPDKQYEIYTSTLGQYSGLKDKNGVEIYEGDIVKQTFILCTDDGECKSGYHKGEVVIIASQGACMRYPILNSSDNDKECKLNQYKNVSGYRSEVIGNIYEDEDLLVMEP